MQKNDIIGFLDDILKPSGFRRVKNTWKKEGEELTKIINLQKSTFGNLYYINYGFDINGLNYDGTSMHIFRGLTTIGDNGKQLLDFDNAFGNERRMSQVAQKLRDLLSGELNEVNTVSELKKNLESRRHTNDVATRVKDFLGLLGE